MSHVVPVCFTHGYRIGFTRRSGSGSPNDRGGGSRFTFPLVITRGQPRHTLRVRPTVQKTHATTHKHTLGAALYCTVTAIVPEPRSGPCDTATLNTSYLALAHIVRPRDCVAAVSAPLPPPAHAQSDLRVARVPWSPRGYCTPCFGTALTHAERHVPSCRVRARACHGGMCPA